MPRYTFFVHVDIPEYHRYSYDEAVTVMQERIDYYEDLGFPYGLSWERFRTSDIPATAKIDNPPSIRDLARAALTFLDEKLADDPEWQQARRAADSVFPTQED